MRQKKICVLVNEETIKIKREMGFKWAWLVEQGIKARDYKDRITAMAKLLEDYACEVEDLKVKNKLLESYIKKG